MTAENAFALDPRLGADTAFVCALPLCEVRLMDDARFPWLVLVPRLPGLIEPFDLTPETGQILWRETMTVARTLKRLTGAEKINTGMLGNIVSQLHVHVVARKAGDAAWPGPVWGHGARAPYAPAFLAAFAAKAGEALGAIA
jgi:diadenosine tetraphosphate (Ap4A) HIT family hydrolase